MLLTRKYGAGILPVAFILITWCQSSVAQNCVPTYINSTVINFACGINCGPVNLQVPHLKSTSDYSVANIPYLPYPYVTASGQEDLNIYNDDTYSFMVTMPFPFCFYDGIFSKMVVGSNGLITFDTTNASCFNAWNIVNPIPYNSGLNACVSSTLNYPRAAIMGMYSDLDPRPGPTSGVNASPPDRKIEWRVEGNAPCRRFIVSYYKIGVFGNNNCGLSTPNTFQIVLYESTGLIDVFIEQKLCFPSTGQGRAILGVQDWDRTRGVAAPGKNATQWTAVSKGYRFVPSGNASRFIKAELFNMAGSLLALADTTTTTEGLLDLSFPNICPVGTSEQFVVKTSYATCDNSGVILESIDTITINKTNGLNAVFNHTDINCASPTGGTITVAVGTGSGVPPFQYSINGGPLQSNNVFTGLAAGTYVVMVVDAAGCSSTENVVISITGNLGLSVSSIPTSCTGANNGSITATPSGGTAPFLYSLNGGPPQSSPTFAGLAPGSYTIAVTDANGCTGNQVATVLQGSGILATVTTTPTSCAGISNGTVTVTPTSGTSPYQYSINGGPWQSSNTFSGLGQGSYTVSIQDANNCISNFIANIAGGAALSAGFTSLNVTCFGANNGTITVNINNGTPPYQYSLDGINYQSGNSFTNLPAGNYTVYFTDNNSCGGSIPVTISQPIELTASVTALPVPCNGGNNGTITINGTGGVAPYQHSIDGTNYQTGNSFTVAAGIYTVYIQDGNGCVRSQQITVNEPAPLVVSTTAINASCNGGADGSITISVTGGTGLYQYSINGTTYQSSNYFNVIPGSYTVTVKDGNNCTGSAQVVVGLTSNLNLVPGRDTVICEGNSVQLFTTTNANQFSWSPPGSLNNPTVKDPIASPVVTTQYVLLATLGNCSVYDTVVVTVNQAPLPVAGVDGDICFGQTYQLQGTGGVQYLWSPSSHLDNPLISTPVSTPPQTITYTLNVVDGNGCNSLIPDQVTINVTPPIIVNTYPRDTIVYAGDQFSLLATSIGTSYSWSPPIGLSSDNIPNPVLLVTSDISFTVTATTSAGCKGEGTVNIKVYKGPDIYVPTGFTPNGDGRNDIFRPIPVGIKEIRYFRVYNRWGQLIFSSAALNDGWDGRIGGMLQPTGTFVWMVQGVTRDDRVITKRGTVTLIR